jgi:hypothetical protein
MVLGRESLRAAAVAAAAALALIGVSCGDSTSPSTSTPTPTVSPQPTPTPPASGGSVTATCAIGKGSESAVCSAAEKRLAGSLVPQVEAAMDLLVQQKPQIFNLTDAFPEGSNAYMILDRDAYMNGLVANLQAEGLCAERDIDDPEQQTIDLKNTNDYSESMDVILSTGHMRRGSGMYVQTCVPSNFPVDRPADAPPVGSGCYRPYPPQVTRFNCKVHLKYKEYYVLDSTPLVSDAAYCAEIGFPGRSNCPVRPEGAVDRLACENWRVGVATDTGRPGPTWTNADTGSFCTGPDSGCANNPESQYQLLAYLAGNYRVESADGASCTVNVQR